MFGQNAGKKFQDIGHVELNDIMQKAIKEAKDPSKIPKEFMDLALYVDNWMVDQGEKQMNGTGELTADPVF